MQVGIYYPTRTECFITPNEAEKCVIKGITTRAYKKAGKGVVRHKSLLTSVLLELGHVLRTEVRRVAVFLQNFNQMTELSTILVTFNWSRLYSEFTTRCPLLLKLLMITLPAHKRANLHYCVCLVISMLAKATNERAALVQTLLSLILLYGHASSQVNFD